MEELTIGPWKADRYRVSSSDSQFFSQAITSPLSSTRSLLLTARSDRSICVEIDEIRPEALDAWRVLTRAVARTSCADAPENLAEDAIRECQATVVRRRRREALALSGWTRRARSSGGNLPSKIRVWADTSPLYAQCRDLLTSGPEIIHLRPSELIMRGNLFGEEAYSSQDLEREQEISELLGAGFEAAPPHQVGNAEAFDELSSALAEMSDEALSDFFGERPRTDDPACSGG